MTAFTFDAKAALKAAQKCRTLPNLPNRPNRSASGGAGLGGLGRLGAARAADPEMTPDELARDLYEERAAIREFCGGQDRAEAERAAWFEARRAAGITALDDWRREADSPRNPNNLK